MNTVWNASRFRPEDPGGSYESYFQRANHPNRPLAFWIRYTALRLHGRSGESCGELWAIYFDGETNSITAVKETRPMSACRFSRTNLDVRIDQATLTDRALRGAAASRSHTFQWALDYSGHEPPLLLLPEPFYERGFPKAKALVGTPNAVYTGTLAVDGHTIPIDGWQGSQNHNWGSRHTDSYAWGQVAGFDNAPDAFFECSTAQIKLGPFWSPRLTLVVLRDEGGELALNGLVQAVRAFGIFDFFTWRIDTQSSQGHFRAHPCSGERLCGPELPESTWRQQDVSQYQAGERGNHGAATRAAIANVGDNASRGVRDSHGQRGPRNPDRGVSTRGRRCAGH